MNWESLIPSGIVVGIAVIGCYGWIRDLRAKHEVMSAEANRRLAEVDADRKDLRTRIDTLDREGVRRADLAGLKGEIIDRIKDVEHNMRGAQATAISEMRGMMKAVLENALGVKL